ncbi:orotidine-5'-phosphate decarboxylase [Candidatus Microgenomates bacterium]|nr:orotidine-5'-phosphate decarboxylase [Candidatus Microgenomates bacterium]MBI2622064.1 orotidine-5'-phosphate decarboxylase [Candidatus Microgenomates bacterium]
MDFKTKLENTVNKNNSLLCIGLDPEIPKIPSALRKKSQPIFSFNKSIIDSTHDLVCAYKPNIAFYEAYGLNGLKQLKLTIDYLKKNYPDIPIILDAKRADIGNTAKMYARAVFEYWNVDAATVYPQYGLDSLLPFFAYPEKCTILIIKTSNPDSGMFYDLKVNDQPFYLRVAKEIAKWKRNNLGLFVGATYPGELKNIRYLFPNTPILTAGIGAQGAKTTEAVLSGIDKNKQGLICNASRAIIYDKSVRAKARQTRDIINQARYG